MADESQGVLADQNNRGLDLDPTMSRDNDGNAELSDVESDQARSNSDKEIVSLDTLSQEELQYIIGNLRYRDILSDLLSPFGDGP